MEEQTTTSETALSGDSPALSYSSREILTQKNLLEEIDIRLRDFQEITLFTTRDGRPLPPIHAKVSFLKPSDWDRNLVPSASCARNFLEKIMYSDDKQQTMASHSNQTLNANAMIQKQKILSHFTTNQQFDSQAAVPFENCTPNISNEPLSGDEQEPSTLLKGSETIDDLF